MEAVRNSDCGFQRNKCVVILHLTQKKGNDDFLKFEEIWKITCYAKHYRTDIEQFLGSRLTRGQSVSD